VFTESTFKWVVLGKPLEYSTSIDDKKIGERQQLIEKLKEYGFNKIRIFKHNELRYDLTDHGTIEATK